MGVLSLNQEVQLRVLNVFFFFGVADVKHNMRSQAVTATGSGTSMNCF